jgi:hypothetical protein
MHTTQDLSSAAFGIRLDGRPATLQEVFPGFADRDRLGVVVRRSCGATGASTLILAAVTAFYDIQRSRADDFFIYPDYFLFHVGARLGDHNMLDVWPSHKEVVVADSPEELLRAINDRGVTRLLVEDRVPGGPAFERESLASARSRVVTALAYAAAGRVADADLRVAGNSVTESYVEAVLEQSTMNPVPDREAVAAARRALHEDGVPVETYRRLSLDEALARL